MHSKNKWAGLALALAIAFSTLVPFFATYGSVAPSKIASFLGEKILICTGDGFALVKLADLQAGKTPLKQHKDYSCALCYIAASGMGKALLFAAALLFLVRENTLARPSYFTPSSRLPSLAYAAARPRAPPASFC